jgi:Spy/CpxP family protein refolding chaperone
MKAFNQTIALALGTAGVVLACNTAAVADNHGGAAPGAAIETTDMMSEPGAAAPSADANDLSEDFQEQPQTVDAFLVDVLDLTEAQQTEIREIFEDYQPRIRQSFQDYLTAMETLNSALVPATDSRLLVRARNEAVDLERNTYDLLFERNIAIRDVLNPNQRTMINSTLRDLLDIQPLAQVEPLPFPTNLIGQSASDTVAELVADGWTLSVRTPSLVQLDRDDMSLDLTVDRSGSIDEATLR